eukprot:1139077-Pelagomonas_calceolata.AAC.1
MNDDRNQAPLNLCRSRCQERMLAPQRYHCRRAMRHASHEARKALKSRAVQNLTARIANNIEDSCVGFTRVEELGEEVLAKPQRRPKKPIRASLGQLDGTFDPLYPPFLV